MTALETLRELSAGCTDSWDLYLRTRGVDLEVTRQEWFDVAHEIELARQTAPASALVAAVRSTLCWTQSVFRPSYIWRYPGTVDDDADELIDLLLAEIHEPGDDVDRMSDDVLRRTYANLLIVTGGSYVSDPTPEQLWVQNHQTAVAGELHRRGLIGGWLDDPDDYRGEPRLVLNFAAHRYRFGAKKSRQLLDAWKEFFSTPSDILNLTLNEGAPADVLDSLRGQTQLRSLRIENAKTADFGFLESLTALETLTLDTYSAETDLRAVGRLTELRRLRLLMRHEIGVPAFLSTLRKLEELRLFSKRPIASLDFVESLTTLTTFVLASRVSGKDYTPLLAKPELEWLRLRPERGMRPPIGDLQAAIPGLVVSDDADLWYQTHLDTFD